MGDAIKRLLSDLRVLVARVLFSYLGGDRNEASAGEETITAWESRYEALNESCTRRHALVLTRYSA